MFLIDILVLAALAGGARFWFWRREKRQQRKWEMEAPGRAKREAKMAVARDNLTRMNAEAQEQNRKDAVRVASIIANEREQKRMHFTLASAAANTVYCGRCHFYHEIDNLEGVCSRFPPGEKGYPNISAWFGCGEFKPSHPAPERAQQPERVSPRMRS